jgi:hypothetical protein
MTVRNQTHSDRPEHFETSARTHAPAARRPFVEPAISSPVDVLAATTFFQVVDSGGTLRRPATRD